MSYGRKTRNNNSAIALASFLHLLCFDKPAAFFDDSSHIRASNSEGPDLFHFQRKDLRSWMFCNFRSEIRLPSRIRVKA